MITKRDIELWRLAKLKPGPYSLNRILFVRTDAWNQIRTRHEYSTMELQYLKEHLRMWQEWANRTKELQQQFMMEFVK